VEVDRLTELYARFAPLLHARARRMVGSEAEDVVQEVFVKLLSATTTDAGLVAWLYTTSTNLCLDRLRHQARRHDGWRAELAQTFGGAVGPVAVDELLANKDLCRKLLALVDDQLQEVAVLVHLDEMTQAEAAEVLGVSRKTVIKRLGQFSERTEKALRRWRT